VWRAVLARRATLPVIPWAPATAQAAEAGQFVGRQYAVMIGVEQIETRIGCCGEFLRAYAAVEIGIGGGNRLGKIKIRVTRGALAARIIMLGRCRIAR
jgi:hypothetical protein